jgi:aspartokinase/homoserine dehydrogenase 1
MTAFAEHLKNHYVPNSVIVDSTASEVPATHYLEWMQKGLHIITPNKKLNSGPLEQYLALRQFQRESYIHYFYEVGLLAPLPACPEQPGVCSSGCA